MRHQLVACVLGHERRPMKQLRRSRIATCAARIASRRLAHAMGFAAALIFAPQAARADAITEPAVFTSSGGVLDILMVAKPKPVPTISYPPPGRGAPINPIGWVYEVCRRPPWSNQCPAGAATVADYGGCGSRCKPATR